MKQKEKPRKRKQKHSEKASKAIVVIDQNQRSTNEWEMEITNKDWTERVALQKEGEEE